MLEEKNKHFPHNFGRCLYPFLHCTSCVNSQCPPFPSISSICSGLPSLYALEGSRLLRPVTGLRRQEKMQRKARVRASGPPTLSPAHSTSLPEHNAGPGGARQGPPITSREWPNRGAPATPWACLLPTPLPTRLSRTQTKP